MIDKHQLFKLSPDILSQGIDDETVLLDMKSEHYFGTNDVGGRVLEVLKEGANLDGIVEVLLREYDVERAQLKIDIRELLQQFWDAGLIQPSL